MFSKLITFLKRKQTMYRYTINSGTVGGCVMAKNQAEAEAIITKTYKDDPKWVMDWAETFEVSIWIDDDISPKIMQVYP